MKKLLLAALIAVLPITANAAALQRYQSGFRLIDGDQLNKMVDVVNGLTGNGTAQPGTFTTLSSTGNITLANTHLTVNASTGATGITGATTITSSSALALAVGRLGATTPALRVDANTTTSITGFKITAAAAGGGLALAATGETNINTTLDAAGNGTLTLNGTATGNIVLTRATTGLSFSGTGVLTARSATATPAAASAVAALSFGSDGITITWGTGAPSLSAAKGSLYIQTDGSSSSTRLFINNGTTNWVAITTAS